MAALAHLAVGLASKRLAPRVPLLILVICAWTIDIVFGVFWLAGLEEVGQPSPWSHGLFMSVIWSTAAALIAALLSRSARTSLFIGLLVFSHWVVDFITQPMGFLYPGSFGPPLLFKGSPTVGLGLYNTAAGTYVGEYGTLAAGLVIYGLALLRLRRAKKAGLPESLDRGR